MDSDLQLVSTNAGRLKPAGVRRLVGVLQSYRNAARATADAIDKTIIEIGETASAEELTNALARIEAMMGSLQEALDAEVIDLKELL